MQMLCCCLRSYDSLCAWRESLQLVSPHCFMQKNSPSMPGSGLVRDCSFAEVPTEVPQTTGKDPKKPAPKGSRGGCLRRVLFGGQKVCGPSVFGRPVEGPKVCGPRVFPFVFFGQKVCGPSVFGTRNRPAKVCGPTFVVAFVVRPFWRPQNERPKRLWSDLCGPSVWPRKIHCNDFALAASGYLTTKDLPLPQFRAG